MLIAIGFIKVSRGGIFDEANVNKATFCCGKRLADVPGSAEGQKDCA